MSHETEAETRALRIDRQLARAGWTRDSRRLIDELVLSGDSRLLDDSPGGYRLSDEIVDYGLVNRFKRPVGIVEAKRSSRSALEGERRASTAPSCIHASSR